jgi:hypothetical protein
MASMKPRTIATTRQEIDLHTAMMDEISGYA